MDVEISEDHFCILGRTVHVYFIRLMETMRSTGMWKSYRSLTLTMGLRVWQSHEKANYFTTKKR